jgi:hypothetical protein
MHSVLWKGHQGKRATAAPRLQLRIAVAVPTQSSTGQAAGQPYAAIIFIMNALAEDQQY